jgi:hypothetical protein
MGRPEGVPAVAGDVRSPDDPHHALPATVER